MNRVALQLYSVREPLAADPAAVLRQIAAHGYRNVELAGTAGCRPAAFRGFLQEAGLQPICAHVPWEKLDKDPGAVLRELQLFGLRWAVVPWLAPNTCASAAGWQALYRRMDQRRATLAEAGIRLCYHNHDFEFADQGGWRIIDVLLESAPDLELELDCGWCHYSGVDTARFIQDHAARVPLLHIKDVAPKKSGQPPETVELGTGATPWQDILQLSPPDSVVWYILEQDNSRGCPVESARRNLEWFRNNFPRLAD